MHRASLLWTWCAVCAGGCSRSFAGRAGGDTERAGVSASHVGIRVAAGGAGIGVRP